MAGSIGQATRFSRCCKLVSERVGCRSSSTAPVGTVDLTLRLEVRASQSIVDESRIKVIAIESAADMERAWAIRRQVFIEEQNVPEEIEMDADDSHAFHAIAILDGVAIGCGRMLEHGVGEVKIGRMAVLREFRNKRVGAQILSFLIERARTRGFRKAILHAQLAAEGFYLREGFKPAGGVFDEAGIAHRLMERDL